jgi:serine phosphatase RsbU (regulator of sigma subunit)
VASSSTAATGCQFNHYGERCKGEMFGFPRLRALVAEHGKDHSLVDSLLKELYSFTGEGWEQEDDITLLTLRRSTASR